jgi:hypothetical protein
MARPIDLTMDCTDATVLGPFWKLALGYIDEPPPAPFATRAEWVASYGEPPEDAAMGAWLCDPEGVGPRLCILPVPEGKVAKNRLHMDIRLSADGGESARATRLAELTDRLVEAGGAVLHRFEPHHVVMADPEGNEFCLCFAKPGD